jgi:hypothetical protein
MHSRGCDEWEGMKRIYIRVIWLPRKISTLQHLYGDKKAANEAAKQEKSVSTHDQINRLAGAF